MNKKQLILLSLIATFAVVATSGCGDKKGSITQPIPVEAVDLSATEANALVESSSQVEIIDVASFDDYWMVHINGAYNYPITNGEFQRVMPSLDKQATYLVYAREDENSRRAVDEMISAGFENVHRLAENFSVWITRGFPITMPLPP